MKKYFVKYKEIFLIILLSLFLISIHSSQAATSLGSRLSGYILLQVESVGEAWYIIPKEQKRVYLQNGSVAYQAMRELSLGITNANLAKIPVGIEPRFNDVDTDGDGLSDNLEKGLDTDPNKADTDNDGFKDGDEIKNNYSPLGPNKLVYDNTLVNRLRGYILLQVEKQGQAWYLNPKDGKRYYMQDGEAAYNIMRFLSLGITNNNLKQVPISDRKFTGTNNGNSSSNNQGNNNNSTSTPTSTPSTTPPGSNTGGNSGGGGGGGGGGGSNTPSADTQVPTTPANLISSISGTQVSLSWTASTDNVGVVGYQILRSTTNGSGYTEVATTNTLSYTNINLSVGTYYYLVRAYDAAGNYSSSSNQATATIATSTDTQAPTTPTNLAAAASGTQITLTWTASTDNVAVARYSIERSLSASSGFQELTTTTNTSYTNTGLDNSTTYYYRVRAQDTSSYYSNYTSVVNATTAAVADGTAPTVPTNLTASASASQISLTWTASTDAVGVVGYQIWRSTTNGGPYNTFIATSNTNSYTNTGLTDGTYYYVVKAYDAAFNYSANSNQASATINSNAPICEATGTGHCYYIATTGSDSNNGSISAPFASTNPIINTIAPGDYIYFRGGSYGPAAKGQIVNYAPWLPQYYSIAYIRRSGAVNNPITFKAYPGESPVFDMYLVNPEFDQSQAGDPITNPVSSPDFAFEVRNADYIVISGLEIIHGSIQVDISNYTWIENNHIHDLLSDRDNNGLIILYFTEHAYVNNNNLHDTYQRSITDGNGGWMVNNIKRHDDAQHNGCITTLSGDTYEGYGVDSSGPFEFTNNQIHDCPVHLFIKNPQGQLVNANGINLLVKDNYFYGTGELAEWFEAANVLFENNLFKGIDGILGMGTSEYVGDLARVNEIAARNITFRNNVFTSVSHIVQMKGQGYLLANGIYSTAMEDKLKFQNNIVVVNSASASGAMGWNQVGYIFGNSYNGMDDLQAVPSKTLSRISSTNNCYINSQGSNLAFLKHWVNGAQSITGHSHSTAQTTYGINGGGDLFPTTTSLTSNFTNPSSNDFSVKSGSACAAIPNVGLSNPSIFAN